MSLIEDGCFFSAILITSRVAENASSKLPQKMYHFGKNDNLEKSMIPAADNAEVAARLKVASSVNLFFILSNILGFSMFSVCVGKARLYSFSSSGSAFLSNTVIFLFFQKVRQSSVGILQNNIAFLPTEFFLRFTARFLSVRSE